MRRFLAGWAVAAGVLGAAAWTWAAPPAGEPGVSLTVYNQNFAVVKEVRNLNLDGKTATVQFRDVAKLIDPTSVHFKSLTDPEGT